MATLVQGLVDSNSKFRKNTASLRSMFILKAIIAIPLPYWGLLWQVIPRPGKVWHSFWESVSFPWVMLIRKGIDRGIDHVRIFEIHPEIFEKPPLYPVHNIPE